MRGKVNKDSLFYLKRTAEQEMQDVIDGRKPTALGFWEQIPNILVYRELLPIYARYYKYAIAKDESTLKELVDAYYMPLTPEADRKVGRLLGYSENSISSYIKNIRYPKPLGKLARIYYKIISTIQKQGLSAVLITMIGYCLRIKIFISICKKEGI